MAGIYVHIPFCRKACVYCDFHFITNLGRKPEISQAIAREAAFRKDFLGKRKIETLYFGGGTPSLLSENELDTILSAIYIHFEVEPDAEITLEANPEDMHLHNLTSWKKLGFNRLSVGIQSFEPQHLAWMNRQHNPEQVEQGLRMALREGFSNFNADLIFGLPGLDLKTWEEELRQLLELNPPHLSIYALTVEPRTALAFQVSKNRIRIPDDSDYGDQFLLAHELLTSSGYEHYELSNYAKPGWRSRHNSAYWQGKPYLGLGPSAHSFDGRQRCWNWANNSRYLQALDAQKIPVESAEVLSPADHYHEYLMTHLRQSVGIDPDYIQAQWLEDWDERFGQIIENRLEEGIMVVEQGRLRLSPAGWLMADKIIADLFLD